MYNSKHYKRYYILIVLININRYSNLILSLILIKQLNLVLSCYQQQCESIREKFSYCNYQVCKIFRKAEENLIDFDIKAKHPYLGELFLNESDFWLTKSYRVTWVKEELEEKREELSCLRRTQIKRLDTLEQKQSLIRNIKYLEKQIPELEKQIAEGEKEVSRLNHYRFGYWHSPRYISEMLINSAIDSDSLINTDQAILRQLRKKAGFELSIVIERSLFESDEEDFLSVSGEKLMDDLLLVLLKLKESISKSSEGESTMLVGDEKVKRYLFSFQLSNQLGYRWAKAFYHSDTKGKNWLVITHREARKNDLCWQLKGSNLTWY